MIPLTKKIEFEAAHRLSNYQGSCDTDMSLDFKTLKSILQLSVLDPLDHS